RSFHGRDLSPRDPRSESRDARRRRVAYTSKHRQFLRGPARTGSTIGTVLRARVLGRMEVDVDGATVRPRSSLRPWALFGALAIVPGTVSRSELATRFWPEVFDTTARANLRSALWSLRRDLGDWLTTDDDRIGIRDGGDVWIDAREFDRA